MNVYTFRIEIKSRKKQKNMEEEIINKFKENSSKAKGYKKYVQEYWEREADNIRQIYPEDAIVAMANEGPSRYYVKRIHKNDDLQKAQFEILVISNNEEINDSIANVYKSLKGKLSTFSFRICDDKALLYITNGKDIITFEIVVKAKYIVKRWTYSVIEKIRLGIVAIAFLITLMLSLIYKDDVSISIMVSCVFWLITEPIMKLRWTRELEVTDLTNCFEPTEGRTVVEEEVKIAAPLVEEWG